MKKACGFFALGVLLMVPTCCFGHWVAQPDNSRWVLDLAGEAVFGFYTAVCAALGIWELIERKDGDE